MADHDPQPSRPKPLPRVFSGMQPSGTLHLGNYMGALKTWVDLIDEAGARAAAAGTTAAPTDLIYCIVDQHAMTVEYDVKEFPRRVIDAAVCYLAAGVDPSRCTLFVQSHVPQHSELAWYFNTIMPMGELSRMTQFKEKSEQHKQSVSTGLFTYPLLMAADILLYRAAVVPVGEDQVQHLEFSREVARKFNTRFTPKRARPTFPEPAPRLSSTPRIMGLDGMHKMSKTRGNEIGLLEEDASIKKKLKGAFTDPQRLRRDDPGRPEICNIYTMHRAVSPAPLVDEVHKSCSSASWGCGDCKEALAKSLSEHLTPIRLRARELTAKPEQVHDTLADGARRCRAVADETMREVRERMGLVAARP